MVYGIRTSGKAHGVVNTKRDVVCKMLDLIGYKEDVDLKKIILLEPSAGEGIFVIEILDRLYESSKKFSFNFEDSLTNIHICELDEHISKKLKKNIDEKLKNLGKVENRINFYVGDFLELDFNKKFDLVVGNPPYVRNENIPEILRNVYQKKFRTFSHRSDLYIPFYEKSLSLLSKNGKLSFICSNRWLKNQYGKNLRQLISDYYKIDLIIDLENVEVFEEDVLGYPAITNISKYETKNKPNYLKVNSLFELLNFNLNDTNLIYLNLSSSNWFSYTFTGAKHEKNLKSIEQQSFKIGIGIATGRDSVFIGKNLPNYIEEDILIPILTSKDVKGSEINWQGNYLMNPFNKLGNLIDLEKYPLAKEYLNRHKTDLISRHVAKKDISKWYTTIDKISPNLISKPKILLPDISANRFINVDNGQFYPHHNLYYIVGGDYEEMCLMASILMSDFVFQQLLNVGNTMNGGYPRWQSQNLRKLLIPNIKSMSPDLKKSLLNAYKNKSINSINEILTKESIAGLNGNEGQLALF